MHTIFKRKWILLFCLMFFVSGVMAQQIHFIYLQTENRQPFYVKLDKKLLSSTASGYLIIPKLEEGEYAFKIGFPKNEWPEQILNCIVKKDDAGYVLKNFGDKGWGLFNLQTMEVVMASNKAQETTVAETAVTSDDFATTLSNVVKDPSIAKKEADPVIEVKQTAAADSAALIKDSLMAVQPELRVDTVALVKQDVAIAVPPKQDAVVMPEPIRKVPSDSLPKQNAGITDSVKTEELKIAAEKTESPATKTAIKQEQTVKPVSQVNKLSSTDNAEGIELVYADIAEGKADTVRVFLEKEKMITIIPDTVKEKTPEQKPEIKQVEKEENAPKFIDITLPNPNAKTDTATGLPPVVISEKKADTVIMDEKPKETVPRPMIANSDCKNFATDDDFLKLRKKMAAENSDDEMLAAAKKVLKTKCFTTDQIKNLSVLFLTDEGKYKFFDLSYPFVSDSYNFSSLQVQLKEAYYIERFKVMIRH